MTGIMSMSGFMSMSGIMSISGIIRGSEVQDQDEGSINRQSGKLKSSKKPKLEQSLTDTHTHTKFKE